jgi:hypothetical protein
VATVHQKVFGLRFRRLATDDVDADLLDPKLYQILLDTLAAGADYLARAYGAYRHALEAVGADPALLDRAARLSRRVAADGPSFGGVGRSWSTSPAAPQEPPLGSSSSS